VEKDFILDPMNLLKDGMYKENDYTPDKAYIIPLVNENVKELPLMQNDNDEKLRQALKEKFQGEAETSATGGAGNNPSGRKDTAGKAFINGKWIEVSKGKKEDVEEKALIKTSSNGILEVDLHATALLETTVGMDNTAILKYQMEKFNEAMKAVLRKKGQRIVFIHGKGDGVLRKAILTELKTKYPACRWQDASFKEYGYGATMVTV
jgi:dsDNA-specific endonuclease/ATPase MutS2